MISHNVEFNSWSLHSINDTFLYLIFYSYIAYVDRVIQKKRRDYSDPTSSANMKKLNDDLASIQNIMRKTIDDVLDRGNKLDGTHARTAILYTVHCTYTQ